MHKLLYTFALCALLQQAAAQQDYSIYFQTGTLLASEELPADSLTRLNLAAYQFGGAYYVLLQFSDIPDADQLEKLANLGVGLHHYVPNYAFVASIPVDVDWDELSARAVLPLQARHKLAPTLAAADPTNDSVVEATLSVKVYPFPGISLDTLANHLKQSGFSGSIQGDGVVIAIDACCVLDVAGHPAVLYVEPQATAPVPEGWTGRTAQRLNVISAGPQLGFDGSGVAISIGDDGGVSHEDFRGRLTDFNANAGGNHGDMTAGLAIGAGNLNPLGMGMAPAAQLYLYPINEYAHLENAVANLQQRNIVITSTSYGEGCGGAYTQGAQSMDRQVYQNEALLHFFSAGNSGEEVCSNFSNVQAPDGGRFGTITGGRKAAKNLITVGNTAYDDRIITNSSRGPAADGRIKPELCAHGQGNIATDENNGYRSAGGTSAAAPSLAGTAAALYQAYRAANGNANPSSALIKALLLNTADDLGNPGPDYSSGFGRVHAGRALESLQNKWYTADVASHRSTKTHLINVPTGVQQLRVLLYWHDPEGLPNAAKALVNDLDLKMETPSGNVILPWVLAHGAQADSLNRAAYRGLDRVNNVEQITLDMPAAGAYTIQMLGNLVPKGPQKYVLVYHFISEEIQLTYPNGGEGLVPDETEVIRWDALGNTGTFQLEYSTDNGSTWQSIANNIPGDVRHFDWQVPNVAVRQARVRVSRNGKRSVSAASFCILALPDFNVTPLTSNAAVVRWRKVPGADRYEVLALGERFMEVIGTTADTIWQFNTALGQSNWYSVRARHSAGASGRRAFAKLYQHQTCDANLSLQLNFDFYPAETSWDIRDANGKIWASGGPYTNTTISSSQNIELCLPYGCYTFNMRDSYNDGMCCVHGQGSYRLLDAQGRTLASGGEFTDVKSHNICLQSAMVAELQVKVVTTQPIACANGQNGAIAAEASGGSGNYNYRWNNGATSATLQNLRAGTYTITVSDGVQQVSSRIVLTQPQALTVQLATQPGSCANANGTSVTANMQGGTPPYTFLWNNGSRNSTLQNLSSGTYALTVTDRNGCTQTAKTEVQTPPSLKASIQFNAPTCGGSKDGKVTATAQGGMSPYQFRWNTGHLTPTVSTLGAGAYSVTVTDAANCENIATVELIEPEPIVLALLATHAFGTNNGTITTNVGGGTPNYKFRWSNGATTKDLSNLGAGTFTLTVTDSKGCSAVASQRIEFQETADCAARGSNTRFEWIQTLQFNRQINESGNDGGFGDYRHLTFNAQRGSRATLVLSPGYILTAFNENWRVWIDWNQDGDFFDDGEQVVNVVSMAGAVTATVLIPANARTGATSLRVSMRYGALPDPCGTFPYGEVEDYTLLISDSNLAEEAVSLRAEMPQAIAEAIKIFPNPSNGQFQLEFVSEYAGQLQLALYQLNGQLLQSFTFDVQKGVNHFRLRAEALPAGTYLLRGTDGKFLLNELLIVK